VSLYLHGIHNSANIQFFSPFDRDRKHSDTTASRYIESIYSSGFFNASLRDKDFGSRNGRSPTDTDRVPIRFSLSISYVAASIALISRGFLMEGGGEMILTECTSVIPNSEIILFPSKPDL
jgi:hypothetical protein